MVNKPLIRPYFLGGVALGGVARIPLNVYLPILGGWVGAMVISGGVLSTLKQNKEVNISSLPVTQ